MQMMFQAQHFGGLVVGLSNVDEWRESRIRHLNEELHKSEREGFYSITSGGVHHPWEHKEFEVRVAITGRGMIFCEGESVNEEPRIFAKVESGEIGVYFEYLCPWQVISYGFPDPVEVAEELVALAVDYKKKGFRPCVRGYWMVLDKPQVPVYHRSLLGKVMTRVEQAFLQGPEFFRDPKDR